MSYTGGVPADTGVPEQRSIPGKRLRAQGQ